MFIFVLHLLTLVYTKITISKSTVVVEISAPNKPCKIHCRFNFPTLASRIYCLFDNMDKTLGKSNQSVINSSDSLSMKIVCKQNCIFQSVSTLFMLLYTFLLPSLSIQDQNRQIQGGDTVYTIHVFLVSSFLGDSKQKANQMVRINTTHHRPERSHITRGQQ